MSLGGAQERRPNVETDQSGGPLRGSAGCGLECFVRSPLGFPGHDSTYPFSVFSSISWSASARALSGEANVFVLVCPSAPILPQRVVMSLPFTQISQNLLDVPSTNSKYRFPSTR